ncbi:hypothetical protein K437DRAFT_273005 [Tilletiaria anomala UBC 951]|uniref:Pre-mRNA-splicing factor CEF1 n=1 Tax=Tilletiaria anomala (strain ATCC 24038 / CBS 436.72 / UBC 951) TaxID=1037660 RepID=A0A066WCB5_TILAU|nr:uncharacterized protein K437DRAFT_273005 [Tilletiaria anomala UBC 951]KDN51356.1 hypothetical protein K437DRAFT_273005 [Tilletiaria anomala UBC 951]
MRFISKGGIWTNVEDEILKSAISKYGKNQWARISSLLVRKTPKQCKARWTEWLDPAIKKTDWSKEEDEKLLHMAKLMPTQWRTIAPIVGRTANQCLERYQKLLDEAEARDRAEGEGRDAGPSSLGLTGDGSGGAAPTADDVRRLRPGERDPDPETKPARPDPIDMDEDEKEMLSEARARLANTQGKKAKRKAREKALEDARRLAMLQKRRELKAAGIIVRPKPPKKGMDYNADIPFEKQPAIGFFDTSEEQSRSYKAPIGKTVTQLNRAERPSDDEGGKKKREREAQERAQKTGKDSFAGQKEEQIRKLKEAEQISKRRKLNLPAAQVGDSELEEIVKLGQAGDRARDLVADGSETSEGLLGDYSALERAKQARTPRTAPEEDVVMREARNLRNMTTAQTPLLGDANAILLQGTGHEGAAPRASVIQTPNPLLTPAQRAARGILPGQTPLMTRDGVLATPYTGAGSVATTGASVVGQTPMRTPFRDSLGVNAEDGMSAVGETPRELKQARAALKRQLQLGLASLPAPKNEFDIQLEDDSVYQEGDEGNAYGATQGPASEEDAAARDARIAARAEEERQKALARRSQAVQRGLPRPANVDAAALQTMLAAIPTDASFDDRAQRLIQSEMIKILHHDSLMHPVPGTVQAGAYKGPPILSHLSDESLANAKALIQNELASAVGFPGANEAMLQRLTVSLADENGQLEALEQVLKQERDSMVWHAPIGMWVSKTDLSTTDVLKGKQALLEKDRDRMSQMSASAAKEEKKLGKILGGYQVRSSNIQEKIKGGSSALSEALFTRNAFEHLAAGEEIAVQERISRLEQEVRGLEAKNNFAQGRFRELDDDRRILREVIEELQVQIDMRQAERAVDLLEEDAA